MVSKERGFGQERSSEWNVHLTFTRPWFNLQHSRNKNWKKKKTKLDGTRL